MSANSPVKLTKEEHLRMLQQKIDFLRLRIGVREEAGHPVSYEKHDVHSLEEALREIREWRAWWAKGLE